MPDSLIIPSPEQVAIRTADGFVVTLACGDLSDPSYQYEHAERWEDALDLYDEPPSGWRSLGISPAQRGVPFGAFSPGTIASVRYEIRRDL